jgi:hypothetical protein
VDSAGCSNAVPKNKNKQNKTIKAGQHDQYHFGCGVHNQAAMVCVSSCRQNVQRSQRGQSTAPYVRGMVLLGPVALRRAGRQEQWFQAGKSIEWDQGHWVIGMAPWGSICLLLSKMSNAGRRMSTEQYGGYVTFKFCLCFSFVMFPWTCPQSQVRQRVSNNIFALLH